MMDADLKFVFCLAMVAITGAVLMMIIGAVVILRTPPESRHAAQWMADMQAAQADPAWRAEQDRLHRKHGMNRGVYYTPDGAYFYDDQGRKREFK